MSVILIVCGFIAGIWLYGKIKMIREGGHN